MPSRPSGHADDDFMEGTDHENESRRNFSSFSSDDLLRETRTAPLETGLGDAPDNDRIGGDTFGRESRSNFGDPLMPLTTEHHVDEPQIFDLETAFTM